MVVSALRCCLLQYLSASHRYLFIIREKAAKRVVAAGVRMCPQGRMAESFTSRGVVKRWWHPGHLAEVGQDNLMPLTGFYMRGWSLSVEVRKDEVFQQVQSRRCLSGWHAELLESLSTCLGPGRDAECVDALCITVMFPRGEETRVFVSNLLDRLGATTAIAPPLRVGWLG